MFIVALSMQCVYVYLLAFMYLLSCIFYTSVSEGPLRAPPLGHGGQQVVTQIIRGQAVTTTVASPAPTGQRLAGPLGPGQTAVPRPQQGQFKLTLTQLSQLTQVSVLLN